MASSILGRDLLKGVNSYSGVNVKFGDYLKTLSNKRGSFLLDIGFYSKDKGTLYKSGDTSNYPLTLLVQVTDTDMVIGNSDWHNIVVQDLKETYNLEFEAEHLLDMNIHNVDDLFTMATVLLEVN